MENKTIADFQGKWTAKINYELPIVSKSFVLNVDNNGAISGKETVTLEGNIHDQEINFTGKLTYHQTHVILDLLGNNDLFGQVRVKAKIDKELPEDGDGKTHYEGTFENEFLNSGEKNTGLFNAFRVSH
jgi:hypothetical protein